MVNVLLTGGAGFIGHHVAEHLLKSTDWEIVFLDRLDLSGNLNRIEEVLKTHPAWRTRCRWIFHDLKAPISQQVAKQIGRVEYIFHLAASTHVDRSITNPMEFVYDNVVGTANLLEYARGVDGLKRLVYFSTDEVFGPAAPLDGYEIENASQVRSHHHRRYSYGEWDRYCSANPYAATKAGAEELCLAWQNTYGLPVTTTHCMNVFGERQSPEKYLPNTINKVLTGQTVIVHADKTKTKAGSRFYIHARNVADAVFTVVHKGLVGEKYNIVGEQEVDNLQLARMIADILGKPLKYEMVDFHSSRPGHDLRYALDGSKLARMGWVPPVSFAASLERVVKWSVSNPRWLL